MIEETIIRYLSGKGIAGGAVYAEAPEGINGEFVTIQMTGHSFRNQMHTAEIAVQAWADTKAEAAALSESAAECLLKMPEEEAEVSAVHLTNEYDFSDDRTKKYRYQAIYETAYFE